MKLARVIGQIVSTIKDTRHDGWKLLIAQPVDCDSKPAGNSVVAIDTAQAGVGDYVLLLAEGKSARQIMDDQSAPCEAIIIGVVDHIMMDGEAMILGKTTVKKDTKGEVDHGG